MRSSQGSSIRGSLTAVLSLAVLVVAFAAITRATPALTVPVQAQWWWQTPDERPAKKKPSRSWKRILPGKDRQKTGREAVSAAKTLPTTGTTERPAARPTGEIDNDILPETAPASAAPFTPSPATPASPAPAGSPRSIDSRPKASARERLTSEPATWAPAPPVRPLVVRNGFTAIVWDDADSLTAIARACETSAGEILKWNNLRRDRLIEGQVLRVPVPAGVAGGPPAEPGSPPLPRTFDPEHQAAREIVRGIRGRNQVALTFDAGGENTRVGDLLDILRDEQTTATFFVTGQFVRDNPAVIRRVADEGYPIHNHSWSHPDFTKLPDAAIESELGKTDQLLLELCGRSTRPYWRPPFGERDRRTLQAAAHFGLQSVYWSHDSLDSYGDRKSAEFLVGRVLDHPENKTGDDHLDGAIILMHVGEPSTVDAVPAIIRGLRDRGYALVTLDEIVEP